MNLSPENAARVAEIRQRLCAHRIPGSRYLNADQALLASIDPKGKPNTRMSVDHFGVTLYGPRWRDDHAADVTAFCDLLDELKLITWPNGERS